MLLALGARADVPDSRSRQVSRRPPARVDVETHSIHEGEQLQAYVNWKNKTNLRYDG